MLSALQDFRPNYKQQLNIKMFFPATFIQDLGSCLAFESQEPMCAQELYPILIKESLPLHEHVVLAKAAVEEMSNAGVVSYHKPAHAVGRRCIWRFS